MEATQRRAAHDAVLAANAAFYEAFTRGDYEAMSRLWASSAEVTCCHPGAPVLEGRERVLASFRQILREPSGFVLRCDQPQVHFYGDDAKLALVTGYEGTDERPAHLAATNVFVREGSAYRLVHHQAGPLSTPVPRAKSAQGTSMLN